MSLKTFTAPTSITISDSDNNRISILKKDKTIEMFTQVNNARVSSHFIEIRSIVEQHLKNLVKRGDRDNYKVRFAKLAKLVTATKADTFGNLKNSLKKELA